MSYNEIMKTIVANILGNPLVLANGKAVKFPYKKSEGLFYYICINKEILRSEAINIFWPETDEQNAKKRLRDALYKIKRTTTKDIFIDDDKSKIKLNTDIIEIDFDNIDSLNAESLVELSKNQSSIEFLGAFIIKDSSEFEEWLYQMKEEVNRSYASKLYDYIVDPENKEQILINFKSIINLFLILDPYNEEVYRRFMQLLADNKEYNEAIKIYYDIAKLLKSDLSIEPEFETRKLFEKISLLKNSSKQISDNYFYGRTEEKKKILEEIYNFDSDNPCKSVALKGEAGVGKTSLINEILSSLNQDKFLILRTNCYQAESEFCYKPLNNVISKLGKHVDEYNISIDYQTKAAICSAFPNFSVSTDIDLLNNTNAMNFTNVTYAIDKVIKTIGKYKKIILFVDDLQWMDNMSFSLISNILFADNNKNIFFLTAFRDDYEHEIKEKILPLITKDILIDIYVDRFKLNEVADILNEQVRSYENLSVDKIFEETEGNALFLSEVIKLIKDKVYTNKLSYKASNIIESRIIGLDIIERKTLDAISMFFHKTSFDMISFILKYDDLSIYSAIESLIEKHLLLEIVDNKKTYYRFSHQKIREYIYDKQSVGKIKLIHKIISDKYVDLYYKNPNPNFLSDLIYHSEKADMDIRAAKYKLEYAKEFYTAYHESFPTISHNFCYNDPEDISISIDFLENLWINFDSKYDEANDEIDILKMELSFILGRLYISRADYKKGLDKLNSSLKLAEKYKNTYYLLEDYKQMIFYYIQTGNADNMKTYIDKALKIIDINDLSANAATFKRLLGLYYIKKNEYDIAKKYLLDSIDIINEIANDKKDFRMAIAASYNYLGQVSKMKKKYSIAFKYFSKAIETSNTSYSSNGLGIFYSNAGQSLYRMNKLDEALKYFSTAINHFEDSKTIWGRDIAECYIASIYKKKNKINLAEKHIKISKILGEKLENPTTLSLIKDYNNDKF